MNNSNTETELGIEQQETEQTGSFNGISMRELLSREDMEYEVRQEYALNDGWSPINSDERPW